MASITATVMAPSRMAETKNSAIAVASTPPLIFTPEAANSESASSALESTERTPPANIASLRRGRRPYQRHVHNIRSQGKNAAILEHQRLDGKNRRHSHAGRGRAQGEGKQRAAHEVRGGTGANGKIDYLRGEDECS